MKSPTVLVHEFFSGGGCRQPRLPSALAGEGLAMLSALLADFSRWGRCRTLTTLDDRLSNVSLAADRVVSVNPAGCRAALADLLARSDAALIVAPENDGTLSCLIARVNAQAVTFLGADASAAATAADKWRCYRLLETAGIRTPATWRACVADAPGIAEKAGYPLVIKPVDGAGSEGVALVTDRQGLERAAAAQPLKDRPFLLQRYLHGDHYSVSMLCTESAALALSLNAQFMHVGTPFVYRGGCILSGLSAQHPAADAARRAVSRIPGLKGYAGIDMVLSDGKWYVIEINPRFTTAYVGLRRAININLVRALWQAVVENRLPEKVRIRQKTAFHKEDFIVG